MTNTSSSWRSYCILLVNWSDANRTEAIDRPGGRAAGGRSSLSIPAGRQPARGSRHVCAAPRTGPCADAGGRRERPDSGGRAADRAQREDRPARCSRTSGAEVADPDEKRCHLPYRIHVEADYVGGRHDPRGRRQTRYRRASGAVPPRVQGRACGRGEGRAQTAYDRARSVAPHLRAYLWRLRQLGGGRTVQEEQHLCKQISR